ncbi:MULTISPECIES: oxidoreductase-like domain-containing protein [Comamonas]|jgi:hypothetical protein|uniref:Oxidoreductase-like domain-containing protein n=2 Tax=Comamonas thiooxydans TaxID=363952 RepID=A0AA42Q6H1_9BURK|nr:MULTISPECIES: oxidoreductase-like domain-containing protein [Comamonas]BCX52234.1 hypothetical protein CTYAZ2_18160 [Comamonas testosteroni]EFI62459.1 hypothetical protein CTS44_07193 [Comamonas thiooxydans]MDH1253581.1 oxidoreductase-like domain-containing protein [Comamonas thiooxydans]MDH1335633.1 oxidoreductase-like domain-containing protein [Comamonas thiooxydans]MDH1475916.1 oxidoreductase-like domain-containing protein [Comamonas thiooxydans]
MSDTALLQPLTQARSQIALWQQRAAAAAVTLRQPPPEPTSCCGRGCNGCVWEGYYDALAFWLEDAAQAMTEA